MTDIFRWVFPALVISAFLGGVVGYEVGMRAAVPQDLPEYRVVEKTEYVAPEGYVIFTFTNKRSWDWPTKIEFQRPNMTSMEFETMYSNTVDRREPVAVPLNRSERVRIKATSDTGEVRVLGELRPKKDDYEVIIKACCVDDFSHD